MSDISDNLNVEGHGTITLTIDSRDPVITEVCTRSLLKCNNETNSVHIFLQHAYPRNLIQVEDYSYEFNSDKFASKCLAGSL